MSDNPDLDRLIDRAHKEGWADWIRSPADHHAMLSGCYFDLAIAEAARDFFPEYLKHSTDRFAGQPFVLLDWQYRNIVGQVHGWRNKTGGRRYRKGYLSTAKKQGKTTLYAGMCVHFLLTNGPGTEIYSFAAALEQASLLYAEAAAMVKADKRLSRVIRCIDSTSRLVGRGRDFYCSQTATPKTKEGLNASIVLADELHAWEGRKLYDAIKYAGSMRTDPLFLIITTAGEDENTICGEEYKKAKRWLTGDYIDDTYFAFIAEADPEDDWTKEETWKKANPSYGVTVKKELFGSDLAEAIESPALENAFRRYRLNQWVGAADQWITKELWDALSHDLKAEELAGRECYAGLDLSAVDDMTALVLVFEREDGIDVIPHFWLPADNIVKLEKKHKVSYRTWAKLGLMTLTPGNVVDYKMVRADVKAKGLIYPIKKLAIDRKFQGQQLESDLMEDGFEVEPAGQGWVSQDLPAKELERLVKSKAIRDTGNPILSWHAQNAVVDVDKAGNYSLNKKKARSKIDGIAALLMGLMLKLRAQPPKKKNYYGENDLIVL